MFYMSLHLYSNKSKLNKWMKQHFKGNMKNSYPFGFHTLSTNFLFQNNRPNIFSGKKNKKITDKRESNVIWHGLDCSFYFPSDERLCVLHFTELWLFIHRGQTQPREKFHKHNTLSDNRDENQIWQSHKAFSLPYK